MHRLLHDDQKESGLLPVLSRLIKQFVFKYQSKEHAKDIVQALHVVLRLLERLSRNGKLRLNPISVTATCLESMSLPAKQSDLGCLPCKRRGWGVPRPEKGSRSPQAQGSQRARGDSGPHWGG